MDSTKICHQLKHSWALPLDHSCCDLSAWITKYGENESQRTNSLDSRIGRVPELAPWSLVEGSFWLLRCPQSILLVLIQSAWFPFNVDNFLGNHTSFGPNFVRVYVLAKRKNFQISLLHFSFLILTINFSKHSQQYTYHSLNVELL